MGRAMSIACFLKSYESMQNQLISAESLHHELLGVLGAYDLEGDEDKVVGLAKIVFHCDDFLKRLYACTVDPGFCDTFQEIHFFKSIKPLFVSEREFHQRLYHCYTFQNGRSSFWEHELKRMNKILLQHSEFISYYKSGCTAFDHAWFMRGYEAEPTTLCMQGWECNPCNTSARDGWVSGLLAVERYSEWLQEKINSVH